MNPYQFATPLMEAAEEGDLDEVRRLLDAGADPNETEGEPTHYDTALIYAVRGGQLDIVRCLLDAGADPRLRGYSYSPLTQALVNDDPTSGPILRVLLDHGADVGEVERETGATVLTWAAAKGDVALIEEAIRRGARLLAGPGDGELDEGGGEPRSPAAEAAASAGQIAALDALLGADLSSSEARAASQYRRAAPRVLADVLGPDEAASLVRRALIEAVRQRREEAVLARLGRDDAPSFSAEELTRAWEAAAESASIALLDRFEALAGGPPKGADRGRALFLCAARVAHLPAADVASAGMAAVERILASGATTEHEGPAGQRALHMAAWGKGPEATRLLQRLIAAGATIDATDREGVTPLFLAASSGSVERVEILLAAGADPRREDARGRGLGQYASVERPEAMAPLLGRLGIRLEPWSQGHVAAPLTTGDQLSVVGCVLILAVVVGLGIMVIWFRYC